MATNKIWDNSVRPFSFESYLKFTSAIEVKIGQVALLRKSAKNLTFTIYKIQENV